MKRSLLDDDSEDDDYPVKHMTPTVEEEDDPLEAYMALNAQALLSPTSTTTKAHKQLLEGNDPMEGYIPPLPLLHGPGEDDSDEDVYRVAALLDDSDSGQQVQHPVAQAPVNHSAMDYYPIPPSSYKTHPDLAQLSPAQIKQLLSDKALSIESETSDTIIPITSFGHLRLDERLLSVIQQLGLSTPTPIQCSALPMALEGRDTIGLAETGSGKTLAYLIPLVVHVQRVLVHTRTRNSYGRSPVGVSLHFLVFFINTNTHKQSNNPRANEGTRPSSLLSHKKTL